MGFGLGQTIVHYALRTICRFHDETMNWHLVQDTCTYYFTFRGSKISVFVTQLCQKNSNIRRLVQRRTVYICLYSAEMQIFLSYIQYIKFVSYYSHFRQNKIQIWFLIVFAFVSGENQQTHSTMNQMVAWARTTRIFCPGCQHSPYNNYLRTPFTIKKAYCVLIFLLADFSLYCHFRFFTSCTLCLQTFKSCEFILRCLVEHF